ERSRGSFRDADSKYLLTGMARCAHCGGPMQIVGADYHRKKGRFYGCSYYKNRGSSICKNSLLVEQEVLDHILLKALKEALTEEMIKVAVEKALEQHRAGQGARLDRRTTIERELSLIEAYENNLVDAIAKGQPIDPLLKKLKAEEARRLELTKELDSLETAADISTLDEARLKRELKAPLADMKGLLARHVSFQLDNCSKRS
ncbi:MAG TPA: recombinase zinc beta ribbon domain-containing protein, partial [Nitrospira sp.]|nr:recombinase zinc beta ribbon domain-containing protein [Nitrospira sp.]